jgi:eukaryotic-like serine/threonine-protein kinase
VEPFGASRLPSPDSVPERFGGYLLLERLGSGSTAEVFRARRVGDELCGRELAVRRLRPELGDDEARRAQLLHEAEVTRGLEHRLFCRVLEVGEAEGLPFLAMELASGQRLARLLHWLQLRGQGAPLAAAVHLGAELCAGLHHAHQPPFGLVHGDVSPNNVLLLESGELKLVDAGGPPESSEGELAGTLGYLAPEQLAGAGPSHLADLYSCAVLLWELLAHQRLFPARSPREARQLRRSPELPSLSDAGRHVEETLRRALRAEPEARWQSGRELRAALLTDARRAGVSPSAGELASLLRSIFGAAR